MDSNQFSTSAQSCQLCPPASFPPSIHPSISLFHMTSTKHSPVFVSHLPSLLGSQLNHFQFLCSIDFSRLRRKLLSALMLLALISHPPMPNLHPVPIFPKRWSSSFPLLPSPNLRPQSFNRRLRGNSYHTAVI